MKIKNTELQPNMLPLGTYNLPVSATNTTIYHSLCQPYQDLNGGWWAKGTMSGITSGSPTSLTLTVVGMVADFDKINNQTFAVGLIDVSVIRAYFGGAGTSVFYFKASGAIIDWHISYDVKLASKPTFLE